MFRVTMVKSFKTLTFSTQVQTDSDNMAQVLSSFRFDYPCNRCRLSLWRVVLLYTSTILK